MTMRESGTEHERARLKEKIALTWDSYNQAKNGSEERSQALDRVRELTSELDSLYRLPESNFSQ